MRTSAAATRERQIIKAFRRIGAVNPRGAVSPREIGVAKRTAFRRLLRHRVLIEADEGTFYVHDPAWRSLRAGRWRVGLTVLLPVVIAGVIVWLRIR